MTEDQHRALCRYRLSPSDPWTLLLSNDPRRHLAMTVPTPATVSMGRWIGTRWTAHHFQIDECNGVRWYDDCYLSAPVPVAERFGERREWFDEWL